MDFSPLWCSCLVVGLSCCGGRPVQGWFPGYCGCTLGIRRKRTGMGGWVGGEGGGGEGKCFICHLTFSFFEGKTNLDYLQVLV